MQIAERLQPKSAPYHADERVLILAPRGRNGDLIDSSLRRAGLSTFICADTYELCREMTDPTGALIVCEEALDRESLDCLVSTLGQQAPWSEIPLLVLTSGGKTTRGSFHIAKVLGPRGNVTLLERPVRILTMITATRAAIRARRRQYEVRDLLGREQAARTQAEAANRAKDHFLATLSHELRTPLNPVLMTVTAMAHDPTLPPAIQEDVDLIRRNIELESKLIDDLLDLTRITRGKLELQQESVDIHALIRHAFTTCCESDIQKKRLTFAARLSAPQHFVWGDSARLSQVFWNLLKNAVKFTPEGGTITVESANGGDGSVVLRVIDTGIGIEAGAIHRIFDAFEQESRGITRRFGGLGLGLAICKALVERHGGTLSVHSDGKDKGSTFTVRLASAPEPRPRNAGPVLAPADGHPRALHILLVEDHEMTARVMVKLLGKLGYTVTLATDVESAIRLVDQSSFDLLISDLGLPDGTGLDVMKHVRGRHGIPAIAVSGYGMEDDVRQSREAGFVEHLVKPIDLPRLQASITRVVHESGPA